MFHDNENEQQTILRNVATLNEALKIFQELREDYLTANFIISESFNQFDKEKFEKASKILKSHQLVAFQSESDGKFCILWKNEEQEEIYALNIFERINLKREDLGELSNFVLEFLSECLQQNHSGLSPKPTDKLNIDLRSLTDENEANLLFYAASNGKTQMIPILLQIAFFDVNMKNDFRFVSDFAYDYQKFDTILVLVENNARFPANFDNENCPNKKLKAFAEMSQEFHEHIKSSNIVEITRIISENPTLRYFYNIQNQSATAAALLNKKFDVYELFLQNNLFFTEDIDEQIESLDRQEKLEIRDIHYRNKKFIHEPHLIELLQRCSVGHDDKNVQERFNHVNQAFQKLNKIPFIQTILKIAALLPNLQIVFDFNRNSVNYLDPQQSKTTFGIFYLRGRIYIGAKQLLDLSSKHEVLATIAHELCHFVLYSIFKNMAKPYKEDDHETETEFEAISNQCRLKAEIDEIISAVYDSDCYPEDMIHAELITRVPHFYAHYRKQQDKIETFKVEFKPLFDFYEQKIVPKLEENLNKLKKNVITHHSVYEQSYEWSNLDEDQKIKVFNGNVKFEGVEAKFSEIYGKDVDTNGVFKKLTSEQIKILINENTLDLNEDQNIFLQVEIRFTYQNLTENFKEKVKNSEIKFQGNKVTIKSLFKDKSENILEKLSSTQIIELIKNKSSIQIGEQMLNANDFSVERTFVEKSVNQLKNVSDLVTESESKTIILLSDDAGTGKTTIFKQLALELKQKFPLKWVQYVDLKSRMEIYQKYQNNCDANNALNILIEVLNLKILDIKGFKELFNDHSVSILWDGFVEISPTYSKFIIQFMKILQRKSQNSHFILTQPHYEKTIQENLDCTVYKFVPYSKKNNEEFLEKFYANKNLNSSQMDKVKEKARKLIDRVEKDGNHVENPLMLEMIAEVSLNDDICTFDVANLYTVYECFINTKLEISSEKGKIVQDEKNENFWKGLNLKKVFQYFAVRNYSKKLKIIHKYQNTTIDRISRYGILIFDSDSKAQFMHRTFRYFFQAQYLIENLYNIESKADSNEIKERFKIFQRKVIFSEDSKVRDFLKGYFHTTGNHFTNPNLIKCFKTDSELNQLFFNIIEDEKGKFCHVTRLLDSLSFTSELLKLLWRINHRRTFFSDMALINPNMIIENFDEIQTVVVKYFSNDHKKQKKILFGENQRGNILYSIYKKDIKNPQVDKYLLSFSHDFDVDGFKKAKSISEFYQVIKSHLTDGEIREFMMTNFVAILVSEGSKMWDEIESKFTINEIQELINEANLNNWPPQYCATFISSKSAEKFILTNDIRIFQIEDFSKLPKTSIKNIEIDDIAIFENNSDLSLKIKNTANKLELDFVIKILDQYKDSIESLTVSKVIMKDSNVLRDMIKNLKNLRNFKALDISFENQSDCLPVNLPKLQSISIHVDEGLETINQLFRLFKCNKSITKLELKVQNWIRLGFDHKMLNQLLQELPNIKHLVMLGTGTASFFDQANFLFRLDKLEAFFICFDWNSRQIRTNFLQSQVGNLKELKLHKLPYDYDGAEVLKYIIEEMNLETFKYGDGRILHKLGPKIVGDITLISNGQKQNDFDEIWFSEVTVSAGMEMLKQFSCIKKICLWLCATGTKRDQIAQMIDQNIAKLKRINEVKIIDASGEQHELPKFIGIFRYCRFIKKLAIDTSEPDLLKIFHDFLPFMTQLEEIELDCNDYELNERFTAIRESCFALQKIKVRFEHLEIAFNVFNNSDVIVESILNEKTSFSSHLKILKSVSNLINND